MKNLVVGLGMVLGVLALPGRAEARGIPVVWNTGQEVFETGPLPAPYDQVKELSGYRAGYLCNVGGVMWSFYSVKDCKPVAFQGTSYSDEPELVKALTAKYTESDMQRGVWGRFGWMGMIGVIVIGAGIWLKELISGKGDGDSTESA
ncbi:MAG: hypothetical protein QM756_15170 [Polyangiaceae bacterium]